MYNINELPDELLVKILSSMSTKEAVSTCILSKRWQPLWTWLPKLHFRVTKQSARDFVDENLPLHRAPVIDSLSFELSRSLDPQDVKLWLETAVSRNVRDLVIAFRSPSYDTVFPNSLFTCESVEALKIREATLAFVPSTVCLPSLKTLQLLNVKYTLDETLVELLRLKYEFDQTLQRLLSACPLLEDLELHFSDDDILKRCSVIVPSLLKLSLLVSEYQHIDGYEVDTSSLEYLKLVDLRYEEHYALFKNMPMLKEAYIEVESIDINSLVGSITSVKVLTICSEVVYDDNVVFNQLEHLKFCICQKDSPNLLAKLLRDSPNLRVLDIFIAEDHDYDDMNDMAYWDQPIEVHECILSSLEIFTWSRYQGRIEDTEIAIYILENAPHLKTATFVADSIGDFGSNLEISEELSEVTRASPTCELVFIDEFGTR